MTTQANEGRKCGLSERSPNDEQASQTLSCVLTEPAVVNGFVLGEKQRVEAGESSYDESVAIAEGMTKFGGVLPGLGVG